jgi:hypothetical protein
MFELLMRGWARYAVRPPARLCKNRPTTRPAPVPVWDRRANRFRHVDPLNRQDPLWHVASCIVRIEAAAALPAARSGPPR